MTLTWGVNTLVGEKVVVCTLNKKILSCKLLHDSGGGVLRGWLTNYT